MFVEHKEQGETQPVKVGALKLSEAIRAGQCLLREDRTEYLAEDCGCAIGMAYVGFGQRAQFEPWTKLYAFLEEKTGISYAELQKIDKAHAGGSKSASQIADDLEARGL